MLRLTLLSFIFCVLCVLPAHAGAKWDFEDGTLQGWTLVSGDVGPQPVDRDDDRYGGNFNKQGKYFIGTYENTKDDAEVHYKSPVFTISANTITLLVGGGNHPERTYVALYVDGNEVYRGTGTNAETMLPRYWDVSKLKGKQAHIEIVDAERGGWGHINIDDIRELTPQEEARIEAEKKQREADNRRWMDNLMNPDQPKVYSGRELTDLAMPLGGIGAGNIAADIQQGERQVRCPRRFLRHLGEAGGQSPDHACASDYPHRGPPHGGGDRVHRRVPDRRSDLQR